mgnify:CR=1 FL=1
MKRLLSTQLARLLLIQSGVLRADEELTPDPKVPASVGDILRSEKYWESKFNSSNEKWKNTDQRISTKP